MIISSLIDQAETVLGTRLSITVATIAFAEDTTIVTIIVSLCIAKYIYSINACQRYQEGGFYLLFSVLNFVN